ncbi:MAG: PorP/SprF family type IX secretion system membrane protein [Flavobacteriales bacterium]|nr:PorP/SprF family type IX secretion system membrane protein [Flavobacteriales bacterium]
MNKLIILITLFCSVTLVAQNRINYSQYMHNQGVFNPAYFEINNQLVATTYLRKQWVGIQGAPSTKSLVAGFTVKDKHNINLNIYQDDITIYSDLSLGLGYNYRILINKNSLLSLGLKGDFGFFNSDYSSLEAQDLDDNILIKNTSSQKYINFGAGLFYQSTIFFTGISAPYLVNNSLIQSKNGLVDKNFEFNHIYFTMGGKFDLNNLSFTPTTLVKMVSGSPLQVEVNANFLIKEKVWLSGGYRSNNAIILSVGYVILENIKLVYSYDFVNFTSANYSSGSHEISIGYGLSFYKNKSFNKRRYFNKSGNYKKHKSF